MKLSFRAVHLSRVCLALWASSMVFLGWRLLGSEEGSTAPLANAQRGSIEILSSLSPLPAPAGSPSNRWADDRGAAELGQRLFFDTRLSGDGSQSCGSCHDPERYFTDGKPRAEGLSLLRHNTPTVVGLQGAPFLTWNGGKDSLWSQALGPIENELEMGGSRIGVTRLIAGAYRADFERVFGALPETLPPEPDLRLDEELTDSRQEAVDDVFVKVGKALEAYERRLQLEPSPFDRYVEAIRDGDRTGGGHLGPAARRGLRAFVGHAGCANCHSGPWFSDFSFHNLGVPTGEEEQERGRAAGLESLLESPFRIDGAFADEAQDRGYRYLDTEHPHHLGAFKTPSLRNVEQTAPYGHAGQFATLREILEFYRNLPEEAAIGHLDPLLTRVSPAFDVDAMLAFLRSLSSPVREQRWLEPPEDPGSGGPADSGKPGP